MDLRDLSYFEAIAELQHMGRASAKLHRTQPALTSSVRRLEADYGAALFEKSGRGIRLTEAGKVLLKWARRMRFDVEDARRELRAIGAGLTGHVRLGIVPTAAQALLPSVARDLLLEAPDVTLRTVVGLIDTLQPQLRAGELDLMVGTESGVEKGFQSKLLAEDMIVVAASEDHEVFHNARSFKDLTGYRWALQPSGAPTRDWLDHTFDRKGLPRPHVQVETTMLLMLPALIVQTGLLSFISRYHLQGPNRIPGLKEVPIRGSSMRRRLVVTYRSNSFLSPAAMRLIEVFERSASAHMLDTENKT
ncbi:DNA-binding transcriptional LysR family regulator [Hydrogenophaga palleronii]|uniref:DNA-binding transcriptional LysR family regulator n=1 Tax=Hydrogenophaga palleronii TaxID=65655 RepID=A0ABU1WIP0_9BURK|nr:LysR substrate-binding domain-containing protein [Hydrogenophaga palleronii]MDR7149143.1 DNA-binding transcriptional LysR family regulator [Hydrogenophaga palleronii]